MSVAADMLLLLGPLTSRGMILVTGAAGFIGSHIVDGLVEAGHTVRALDALLPSAHRETPELRDDVEFIHGDVRDPETVDRALQGVDAVCHQAAMVGLGVDLQDMPDYVGHNDLGTAVLLAAMARHGRGGHASPGRLVLASSMVVYGEGRYRCAEHGIVPAPPRAPEALESQDFEVACPRCGEPLTPESIPEDAPLDPRNVYAATKLHQEHLAFSFAREAGVGVTALRYHNVYGPRMPRDTPYAGVASIFASSLAGGRPPQVFEDGGQLRDFIHVSDIARANILALTAPEPIPGALNVATGHPRSVGDMARALAQAVDPELAPQVTGAFRLGDVRHVFASAEKAAEQLGFRAQVGFEAGMTEFATAPLRR